MRDAHTSPDAPRRVLLLDEVRGLCILLMVAYHGAYDLVYIFKVNFPLFHHWLLSIAQPVVAGIFIFISGIACRYSRSNVRRGCIALGLGLAMTAATLLFVPEQAIYFGILHFLGTCMVLFGLLRPLLDRLPPPAGTFFCALLFCLTLPVGAGYIGFGGLRLLQLPPALYGARLLFPLGFAGADFASADYFPLLPWLFVFLGGAYTGVRFLQGRMPGLFYRGHSRFLAVTGRHTLIIYVLHQPVLYTLFSLLAYLMRL